MIITKKLLIVSAIIGFGLVNVGLAIRATHHNSPTVADSTPDDVTMWALTNAERSRHGMPPLTLDPRLTNVATARCEDMVQQNYYDHVNPQGKTPQDFIGTILDIDIGRYYSGENIAEGNYTSKSVVDAWIASPEHELNIVRPQYKYVGFAVCTNAHAQLLIVQDFLSDPQ